VALESIRTKLRLDGSWNLEELSEATRDYIQLYGFVYSLLGDLPFGRRSEIDYLYGKFPWRGGYSTVNFFNQLFHKIPPELRPNVNRIRYESPGFIELEEVLIVAVSISAIVKAVCSSINMAHDTYRKIQKASTEHELTKIDLTSKELELTQRQLAFCDTESKRIAKILGLTDEQESLLDQRIQGNVVAKLKLLLSVYRRVEPLAKKQLAGKINITAEESDET
jgi:hypothetical protein